VTWLLQLPSSALPGSLVAYAGWNTAGNSLGTAVANSVLNAFAATGGPAAQAAQAAALQFTMLRVMEDCAYQAQARQALIAFVQRSGDSPNDLRPHLGEYESFVMQPESMVVSSLNAHFQPQQGQALRLDAVYFPWNRTFEVGFQYSSE
jgi:hypothetical protein